MNLPAPTGKYATKKTSVEVKDAPARKSKVLPAYPHRGGFVPRSQEDFGDGGAYPEIHIPQYPLNMGKPGVKSKNGTLSVGVDSKTGLVRYDGIAKQKGLGSGNQQLVQTSLADTKEKRANEIEVALPDSTEEESTAERTRKALDMVLSGKVKKDGSIEVGKGGEEEVANYVRYTPNPQAPGYSAPQRVIKVVEAQVDPMEPPKHKLKKAPFKPENEIVPVLHKADKITLAEHKEWKIPPVVSNWKNESGFVIALDKRLAADGRGASNNNVTINDKFASLSEALYMSERKAADDLKIRNNIRKQIAIQEKEEKEASLRDLAARARRERAGIAVDEGTSSSSSHNTALDGTGDGASFLQPTGRQSNVPAWMAAQQQQEKESLGDIEQHAAKKSSPNDTDSDANGDADTESENEKDDDNDEERQQRDILRKEMAQKRLREIRGGRKGKEQRDEGRDISEKIALGQYSGRGGGETGEAVYDNRLFNQSSGIGSGFAPDDEYDAYNKPLFDQSSARSAIYRPKADETAAYGTADEQIEKLQNTNRFRADKGFAGTEGGPGAQSHGPRTEPVQFEKAKKSTKTSRDDVFDIDDLVGDGNAPKKTRRE